MADTHAFFIMPDIRGGGVGKMRLAIIEEFQNRGLQCTLILRSKKGELLSEATALCRVEEVAPGSIYQFAFKLSEMIREKKPTHIITCFQDIAFLTWIAMKLSGVKVTWIHSIHNSIGRASYNKSFFGSIKHLLNNRVLIRFILAYCDSMVVVSRGIKQELRKLNVEIPSRKVSLIYNPVIEKLPSVNKHIGHGERLTQATLVSIGRLEHQKGFDLLIKAMRNQKRTVKLKIFGNGSKKAELESLINFYGLNDQVFLCGHTQNPIAEMKNADIFILPSRFEGFGNVLVEALSCGTQIIAADCPVGPREILNNGELGQLVPTENSIALHKAIKKAINREYWIEPEKLTHRALEFSKDKSLTKWFRITSS